MLGSDELVGQTQEQQQLPSPNMQTNITAAGKQSSAGLVSALSNVAGLSQTTIPNLDGQSSGLSNTMEVSPSTMNSSPEHVLSQNALLANAQRFQLHARQQQQEVLQQQQQQQQTQAQQDLLYQHQLQQQQQTLLKQKLQPQSNLQPSNFQQQQLQHHQQSVQQKQQQQQQSPMLQQSQSQSSHQSVVQPSQQPVLQSTQHSGLQQAVSSVLQPVQQSVLQQCQQSTAHSTAQFAIHQLQQSVLRQQQPQQISLTQHQPAMVQQSILQSQQQLMAQQNVQEQQHQLQQILQQAKTSHHPQSQQTSSSILQLQSQQQSQKHQQPILQLQSQTQHLQQQQSLLQQPNTNQQEMQQRLQTSEGFLQQHAVEQQKLQLQTQQQQPPEASSSSMDSSGQTGQSTVSDHQEKVYQKLQSLKETHFQEIKELYTRLIVRSQQTMVPDQLEKLKQYKSILQRIVTYFQVPKCNIPAWFNEDKVHAFEKQVVDILNSSKQRKSALQQQQGQLLQSQISMQSIQQQSQPKMSSVQQHGKHVIQPQQLNSLTSMPLQKVTVSTLQPYTMQPGADSNALQGPGMGVLMQCSANAFQQNNNVNRHQQNNVSIIRHNGITTVQQNGINPLPHVGTNPSLQNNINTLQSKTNTLQQQRQVLKQQQDQQPQVVQAQQFKQQIQQCQMNHHMLQHQQQQQIQQKLQKQRQAAQLQAQLHPQQIPQAQLRNDGNSEIKARQAAAIKKILMQRHHLSQYSAHQQPYQQQEQQSSSLSVLSPQLLQSVSSQISQQFSPQIDQQVLLTSSLQFSNVVKSATSSSMALPASTHSIPSSLIEDVEKQPIPVISSMSRAESAQGFQQSVATSKNAQSLTVGTPGISSSDIFGDFAPGPEKNIVNQDGSQTISLQLPARDKSAMVVAFECLAKTVNSMPAEALNSAMNDVSSIVSLLDKIAGSAPGNGSKAVVGEDLVSMTKCRMQGRKFLSLDKSVAAKKMKRCMSSMPLSTVTSNGSLTNNLQLNDLEFLKMQSAATSIIRRPRLKLDRVLRVEIQEVNRQLIETVVDISDNYINASAIEGRDGIVVKCVYNAATLSTNMEFKYTSNQMSLISPLWLFIPTSYPECSPVVLDQVPVESIKEHEDLSSKTKSMFDIFVRDLPQPMSLGALARTWDACARNVLTEFAHQSGGGSFSSQYGAWKYCVST